MPASRPAFYDNITVSGGPAPDPRIHRGACPRRPRRQDRAWSSLRSTQQPHEGHIQAGGVHKDVTFVDADHEIDDQIDAAYRTKYARYAESTVTRITSPEARSTTIKLVPRSASS
jgi:hypothetical protein